MADVVARTGARPHLVASRMRHLKLQAIVCTRADGNELVTSLVEGDYQKLVSDAALIASQPGDVWAYVNRRGVRRLFSESDAPQQQPAAPAAPAAPAGASEAAGAAARPMQPSLTLQRSASALAAGKVKSPDADSMWAAVQVVSAVYEDAFSRVQTIVESQQLNMFNIMQMQNNTLMDTQARLTEVEVRYDQTRAELASKPDSDPVEAEFIRLAGNAVDKWQPGNKQQNALPAPTTTAAQLPAATFDFARFELD